MIAGIILVFTGAAIIATAWRLVKCGDSEAVLGGLIMVVAGAVISLVGLIMIIPGCMR